MINQTASVTMRVLSQLRHDRRFLGLSIAMPVILIYMLYVFFDAVDRPFFNPKEFVPSIAAFIVHFITYILSAIVLVRERTTHTMVRMFVSGYRREGIISGYVLAYSVIATVQSLIVLLTMNWFFELGYSFIDFLSMYFVIWLLAVISIALGILVSNFARTEGQVLPMIPLILYPSLFFSGIIVSVDQMPRWAGWLSYTSPMYYANGIIDDILNHIDRSMLAGLILYGVIVLMLAILTLREDS